MSHCMQNFTFLQIRLSGILIGGSPSNALLADPEQALPGELGRLPLTASHLMAWKTAIEMIVYLKTQIAFPSPQDYLQDGLQIATHSIQKMLSRKRSLSMCS